MRLHADASTSKQEYQKQSMFNHVSSLSRSTEGTTRTLRYHRHQSSAPYSFIKASISASTLPFGTETTPVFETRNLPLKFHVGSFAPVSALKNFHTSGALSPKMLPSFIKVPGKFFPLANAWTSSSVLCSWAPNSLVGKARISS
jgi:hypothetical protein